MHLEFCSFFQIFDFLDFDGALILVRKRENELAFDGLNKAVY